MPSGVERMRGRAGRLREFETRNLYNSTTMAPHLMALLGLSLGALITSIVGYFVIHAE
jgi:hypothetical protein